jgi:hypothetical protein
MGFRMDAMAEPIPYPRFSCSFLEEALGDTPVVLVHGKHRGGEDVTGFGNNAVCGSNLCAVGNTITVEPGKTEFHFEQ